MIPVDITTSVLLLPRWISNVKCQGVVVVDVRLQVVGISERQAMTSPRTLHETPEHQLQDPVVYYPQH